MYVPHTLSGYQEAKNPVSGKTTGQDEFIFEILMISCNYVDC